MGGEREMLLGHTRDTEPRDAVGSIGMGTGREDDGSEE